MRLWVVCCELATAIPDSGAGRALQMPREACPTRTFYAAGGARRRGAARQGSHRRCRRCTAASALSRAACPVRLPHGRRRHVFGRHVLLDEAQPFGRPALAAPAHTGAVDLPAGAASMGTSHAGRGRYGRQQQRPSRSHAPRALGSDLRAAGAFSAAAPRRSRLAGPHSRLPVLRCGGLLLIRHCRGHHCAFCGDGRGRGGVWEWCLGYSCQGKPGFERKPRAGRWPWQSWRWRT